MQLRLQSTRAAVDRVRLRLRETNYEAVTDASDGRSADGVRASLARKVGGEFQEIAKGRTGPNGLFYRCTGLERGEPTELRVWRDDKANAPAIVRFVPSELVTVLRIDVSRS